MTSLSLFLFITSLFVVQQRNSFVNGQSDDCPERQFLRQPPYLSKRTIPDRYKILLKVDLDNKVFSGSVSIDIDIHPQVQDVPPELLKYIYLKIGANMRVTKAKTKLSRGRQILHISNQCRFRPFGFWMIETQANLNQGRHQLELEFSGNITDASSGIYRRDYEENGKKGIVGGNASPTKNIFPSFDQPDLKALFEITMQHKKRYNALTSFPFTKSKYKFEWDGLWYLSYFETSPMRLSTNQISFNLNQFSKEQQLKGDLSGIIWARQDFIDAANYGLSAALHILDFYKRYLNKDCPFQEVNLVAVPQFRALLSLAQAQGGLVTFDEGRLLFREGKSTVEDKVAVAGAVAHELAHFWFAVRVTSEHPRFVWLEEGFAEWMRFKGVADWERHWKYLDLWVFNTRAAFDADSKETHPLIRSAQDANAIGMPAIIYSKGAAIVAMMEGHMGEVKFQKAMRRFVHNFDGRAVSILQLLNMLQLEAANKINVGPVYHGWLSQPGFPFITVTRNASHVNLRQERFLQEGQQAGLEWQIPVWYYLNGKKLLTLFRGKQMSLSHNINSGWIKLNVDHQGFYITLYQDWNQLNSHVASLSSRDTAGLLLDIVFLTLTGKVQYGQVTGLVRHILNGSDSVVTWRMGQNLTDSVYQCLKSDPGYRQQLSNMVKSWVEGKYKSDMWNEVGKTDEQVRFAITIIQMACDYGIERCLADAKRMFDAWKFNNTDSGGALREPITWPSPNTRSAVLNFGLQASKDPGDLDLVDKYIHIMDKDVQNNSGKYLEIFLRNIVRNPVAIDAVWEFFKNDVFQHRSFRKKFPIQQAESMENFISIFAEQFSKQGIEQEIEPLLESWNSKEQKDFIAKVKGFLDRNRQRVRSCVSFLQSPPR